MGQVWGRSGQDRKGMLEVQVAQGEDEVGSEFEEVEMEDA